MQPNTTDMVMATPASGQYEDQSASRSRPSSSPVITSKWLCHRDKNLKALAETLFDSSSKKPT